MRCSVFGFQSMAQLLLNHTIRQNIHNWKREHRNGLLTPHSSLLTQKKVSFPPERWGTSPLFALVFSPDQQGMKALSV